MFTRNQIEEIRRKLQFDGVRDTEFPQTEHLTSNDIISVVQSGVNKKMSLNTFARLIGNYGLSDFIIASKNGEYKTLEQVIKETTELNRKPGQVVTFLDEEIEGWAIWQFKGKSKAEWFDLTKWDNILAKVDNHFKGLFLNEKLLFHNIKLPTPGDFAFVGVDLKEAMLWCCDKYGHWYETNCPALSFADKFEAVYSEDYVTAAVLKEATVDRAVKDSLGNTIHDTYITREQLQSLINRIDELEKKVK